MEPIQTFIRIRPSGDQTQTADKDPSRSYLNILNTTEILMTPPPNARIKHPAKYKFTKVFDEDTSQTTVFEETCLPLLASVLRQEYYHALLFAYGVSNSGKTHSIIGSSQPGQAGILPRTLAVIFRSIEKYVQDSGEAAQYRPVGYQNIEAIDSSGSEAPSSINALRSHDNDLITLAEKLEITLDDVNLENLLGVGNIDIDSHDVPLPSGMDFTVWVSCAEIYTEKIYDLLAEPPKSPLPALGAIDPKRPTLDLRTDASTKQKYIHGLKEIRVRTLEDALLVVQAGFRQRQVFETLLNKTSSRSHCIFTIKILKAPTFGNCAEEAVGKISVSRLSIVDLAGSERLRNTNSSGQRKKEAGNINNSLMYLNHCMEILRLNQMRRKKDPLPVPYQHSKLTHLFQSALDGQSKNSRVCVIINANPHESMFDETTQALRFSSTAMSVSTVQQASSRDDSKCILKASSDTNQKKHILAHSKKPISNPLATSEDQITQGPADESSILKLQNQVLQNQVKDLYEKLEASEGRNTLIEAEERKEFMADLMEKLLKTFTKMETHSRSTSPMAFGTMEIDKKEDRALAEATPPDVLKQPYQVHGADTTTKEPGKKELIHLDKALQESEAKRVQLEQDLDAANKSIAAWEAWLGNAPSLGLKSLGKQRGAGESNNHSFSKSVAFQPLIDETLPSSDSETRYTEKQALLSTRACIKESDSVTVKTSIQEICLNDNQLGEFKSVHSPKPNPNPNDIQPSEYTADNTFSSESCNRQSVDHNIYSKPNSEHTSSQFNEGIFDNLPSPRSIDSPFDGPVDDQARSPSPIDEHIADGTPIPENFESQQDGHITEGIDDDATHFASAATPDPEPIIHVENRSRRSLPSVVVAIPNFLSRYLSPRAHSVPLVGPSNVETRSRSPGYPRNKKIRLGDGEASQSLIEESISAAKDPVPVLEEAVPVVMEAVSVAGEAVSVVEEAVDADRGVIHAADDEHTKEVKVEDSALEQDSQIIEPVFAWSPSPIYDYEDEYDYSSDIGEDNERFSAEESILASIHEEQVILSPKKECKESSMNMGQPEGVSSTNEDSNNPFVHNGSGLTPPPRLFSKLHIEYDDNSDDACGGGVGGDNISRCSSRSESSLRGGSRSFKAYDSMEKEEEERGSSPSPSGSPKTFVTFPMVNEESGQAIDEEEHEETKIEFPETPNRKRKRKLRAKKAIFEEEMEETIGMSPPTPTKRTRKKGLKRK
ncbi:hypothetical protein BGX27_000928 [Mortierella sp. AM989]|nr:hypothetical protein BGX27_000928 [Mortierella sp. AM989]